MKERLNGLVEESVFSGKYHTYRVNINTEPFFESLDKREAKAKEIIWQWGELKKVLSLSPAKLGYLKEIYKQEDLAIEYEYINSGLNETGKGYLEFADKAELSDDALKKKVENIDKIVKLAIDDAIPLSKIYDIKPDGEVIMSEYTFSPSYRWKENCLEIYEK